MPCQYWLSPGIPVSDWWLTVTWDTCEWLVIDCHLRYLWVIGNYHSMWDTCEWLMIDCHLGYLWVIDDWLSPGIPVSDWWLLSPGIPVSVWWLLSPGIPVSDWWLTVNAPEKNMLVMSMSKISNRSAQRSEMICNNMTLSFRHRQNTINSGCLHYTTAAPPRAAYLVMVHRWQSRTLLRECLQPSLIITRALSH